MRPSDYKLQDVLALAHRAAMSTTYKPALLKAITRIISRERIGTIPLLSIGAEFTKLYWNQTVVFHLRQAAVIRKEPEVIRAIRNIADQYNVRDLSALPEQARQKIEREMARILTLDVLQRFHASKPAAMPFLFSWSKGDAEISLGHDALDFISKNTRALEFLANYWWAGYLEKVNLLAPLIIDKVKRDGARRSSLARFLRILRETDQPRCFYCGREFSADVRTAVDHVLPWSFLLSDPLWDLVLACASCNAAKSDRLPEKTYIDKLVGYNAARQKHGLAAYRVSPLINSDGIFRLYEAAISLEWPGLWKP